MAWPELARVVGEFSRGLYKKEIHAIHTTMRTTRSKRTICSFSNGVLRKRSLGPRSSCCLWSMIVICFPHYTLLVKYLVLTWLTFFSMKTSHFPRLLSDYGKMRSGRKPDLLQNLEDLVPHHNDFDNPPAELDMVIIDGAAAPIRYIRDILWLCTSVHELHLETVYRSSSPYWDCVWWIQVRQSQGRYEKEEGVGNSH